MQYHEFGDNGNPTLLVMHGMLCDWKIFGRSERLNHRTLNSCLNIW